MVAFLRLCLCGLALGVASATAEEHQVGEMALGDAELQQYADLMMARGEQTASNIEPSNLDEAITKKKGKRGKKGQGKGPEITPSIAFGVKKCCEKEVQLDSSYILPLHSCAEVRRTHVDKVLKTIQGLEKRTGITNREIVDWIEKNDCRQNTFPTYSPTKKPRGHGHTPHTHCPHTHTHTMSKCSKKCGGGTQSFCRREDLFKNKNGCENKCGYKQACNTQKCKTSFPTSYPTSHPTMHVCDRHAMGHAVSNCAHASQNGICYKQSRYGIFSGDYTCGCKAGYHCTYGCDKKHQGHTCAKTKTKKVDCVGKFDDYSSCSRACGTEGKWVRVYKVTQEAANGGKQCPHEHGEVEESACNRHECGCSHVHCMFERKELYVNAGRIHINGGLPDAPQAAHDMSMGGQFYVHKTIVVRHDAREGQKYGMQHKCALANKGLEQEECRCICANHDTDDSESWEKCKYDGKLFKEDCQPGAAAHWLHDQANAYRKGLSAAKVVNQREFFHSCNKLTGCDSEEKARSRYAPITDINEKMSELVHEEQHLVADGHEEVMACPAGYVLWAIADKKYVCNKRVDQHYHRDIKEAPAYENEKHTGLGKQWYHKKVDHNTGEVLENHKPQNSRT